jgi:hypothetical protein
MATDRHLGTKTLASNQPARYLVVVGRTNRLGTEINNYADI